MLVCDSVEQEAWSARLAVAVSLFPRFFPPYHFSLIVVTWVDPECDLLINSLFGSLQCYDNIEYALFLFYVITTTL